SAAGSARAPSYLQADTSSASAPFRREPLVMVGHAGVVEGMRQGYHLAVQRISWRCRPDLIATPDLGEPQCATVELQMVVRAEHQHVARLVRPVMWLAEAFDMGCL